MSQDAVALEASAGMPRWFLWDCDGVLQHGTGADWGARLDAFGGPGFAEALFAYELPALRGERPFRECLAELLAGWPQTGLDVDDLLHMWEAFTVDAEALGIVAEVRSLGVRCALATNQQDHRAAYMREHWGYDAHVDRSFYSCDVGAMKPEPAFFAHIIETLGEVPADIAFIDDVPANVEAAQALGIRALRHDPASGPVGLRADVARLLAG
ncbi:HAD family hydrolase [Actinomycetota bacterium]